jgi:Mlc titration factor MtfA (ptsG expression regulator)
MIFVEYLTGIHIRCFSFKLRYVCKRKDVLQDESLLKIREEEEKRKEVSAKFQTTLNEITALMQQNNEKNSKLREDNLEVTKKFKTVCEQYELREQVCLLLSLPPSCHFCLALLGLSKEVFSFVLYF